MRASYGDTPALVFVPAAGLEPAPRAEAEAFLARVRGTTNDIEQLLWNAPALGSLPLYATQPGRRFDPALRAKLVPKRRVTYERSRHASADDF
jgi:hypothetical protein